jgi:hypothetical protein
MKKAHGSWFMAHHDIAFQERFPLSLSRCISLPLFSFFVVTIPVMGVNEKFRNVCLTTYSI